jgi:predicted DNA helicase
MRLNSGVILKDILVYSYEPRIEAHCRIDELEETIKRMLTSDSKEIRIRYQRDIEKSVRFILAGIEKTFEYERKEELEPVGKGIREVRYYKKITQTKNLKESRATPVESRGIFMEDRKLRTEAEAGKLQPSVTMATGVSGSARVRFCSQCGTWLPQGSIHCSRCGHIAIYEDKDIFLDFMRDLLRKERQEEKERVVRDKVFGDVVSIDGNSATIECYFPKFEEGDVVGYLTPQNLIEPLGVAVGGGKILTLSLRRPTELREGQRIGLCETEVLVGYDLQLELIGRIKEGKISELEKHAVSVLLEKPPMGELGGFKLSDTRDVEGSYLLDGSQMEAVEVVLGLKDGEIALIIGPPGTGKTRVIAKAALELSRRGERVLITSHTNRAVDNALDLLPVEETLRVGRPEKVLPQIRPYLLSWKARTALGSKLEKIEKEIQETKNYIRSLIGLKKEWYKMRHMEKYDEIKSKLDVSRERLRKLCEVRNRMLMEESENLVKQAAIIGSTLIKTQLPPLDREFFDIVLIDECSQASTTLAMLGMVKARKWVLVGDHKQLQPIFQTLNPEDRKIHEELSVFCQMLKKYENRSRWLKLHYRSNSEIIGFSCQNIYDGNIKPVDACRQIRLELKEYPAHMEFLNPEIPVVFLNVDGSETIEKDGSRRNEREVEVIKEIVYTLKNVGVKSSEIGVITPYRAQRMSIKEVLDDEEIEVNTVDSFQGREKDVIIFSITSTKDLSFVDDEKRLNVAFTRARRKLIVLGNADSVNRNQDGLLYKFFSYAKERGGYFPKF